MVRVLAGGTLIRCDAAARELLLYWSEREKFVMRVIDSEHLLVKTAVSGARAADHSSEAHKTTTTHSLWRGFGRSSTA